MIAEAGGWIEGGVSSGCLSQVPGQGSLQRLYPLIRQLICLQPLPSEQAQEVVEAIAVLARCFQQLRILELVQEVFGVLCGAFDQGRCDGDTEVRATK